MKKAQEEMVGFALIVIVVAVVLLVFLSISLKNKNNDFIESYEAESFVNSFLQYTTDCSNNLEYLNLERLIYSCNNQETCIDGREACAVLEDDLKGIVSESWNIVNRPVSGYVLNISSKDKDIISIKEGNISGDYKGTMQALGKDNVEISFIIYGRLD